ncbi:MAG: asparagine synthase (glutamine-hydrolyzing) [Acidobacteriota bacterium]
MCGIAGIVGGMGKPAVWRVEGMLETLRHRGPDSGGVQSGGGWAIGARRLAVIDLVSGDQPVGNEAGDVWAVLNGEVYNYGELREQLKEAGHRLRSNGDSEVLVHLWEDFGPSMVARLHGMFALAVVDDRRRTLLLARDRAGKKPLYWTRQGGQLIFGSELKALRSVMASKPEVDREALAAFLGFGFVPEGQCILRGVEKLPPATWLTLDLLTGEVNQRRYWQLDVAPDEAIGPEAAARELLESLDQAVTRRLRADVPLAVFLSGGLDSGLVSSLAARQVQGLRALTVSFAGGASEAPLARATAERAGLELVEMEVDAAAGRDLLPRLAEVYDEPLADSSVIPTLLVAERARQHATVVLNGDGSDEVLCGYRRFLAARLLGLPGVRVWGELAGWLAGVAGRGRRASGDRLARGLRAGHRAYLSWGPVKFSAEEVGSLLPGLAPVPPELEALLERTRALDAVSQLRLLEFEFFLPGDLLVKMDRATMAASLEARSPFLDHRLLERVAAFPPSVLVRLFQTKSVVRDAARDFLPARVRLAAKRGFEVPLTAWLEGDWASEVRDVLEDPFALVRRYIPGSKLVPWLGWRRRPDRRRAARAVFTLVTLEHWLRRWS